ncbi:hypothetical protein ACJJTC_001294 [Scirpophaga incertulas]
MSRVPRSPQSRKIEKSIMAPGDDESGLTNRDSITNVTQRTKSNRDSCSEDQLNVIREEIRAMFAELNSNQNKRLNQIIKDVAEIKAQSSAIHGEVETLEKEKKEHLLYIASLEAKIDDIQRSNKSSTIELRNVPCQSKKENQSVLVGIVQQTCKVLNIEYGPQDLKDVYGINTKSGGTTIVAEFTQALKKQEVLKTAKAFNKENRNNRLNSTHIGLPGKTVPIYISESLTSKARRLFYLARDLAKSTDYKYCWTSNGKVFIRKNDDSPHIEIKSENDVLNQKSLK